MKHEVVSIMIVPNEVGEMKWKALAQEFRTYGKQTVRFTFEVAFGMTIKEAFEKLFELVK